MGMYGRDFEYIYTNSFIRRVKPNHHQIEILHKYMLKCLYPNSDIIEEAHVETNLTHKFIRTWFQNKRAAFRKRQKKASKKTSVVFLGTKHELCKFYRQQGRIPDVLKSQDQDSEEGGSIDGPEIIIIDCTEEVISSYGNEFVSKTSA